MANGNVHSVTHDLISLLSSSENNRDFLIRNNGDQVKITDLKGKIVGLYFSGSWCGPCRFFTPKLVEAYQKLYPHGDLEVVFISSDRDEDSFNGYFSKMPWLSVPYLDLETRKSLKELFQVRGIPHLVIIDAAGKVLTDEGNKLIKDYGAEAYPFTPERIDLLVHEEEEAKRNQTLKSVLGSGSGEFVISNDGNEIPVSELEGKVVGLYFAAYGHRPSQEFTQRLVDVYNNIKEKVDDFEIVRVPLDSAEENFKKELETMPWLSLPFNDKRCGKLIRYFELRTMPTLVIIGADGKTLHPNVADLVDKHGVQAYPFTPEKIAELVEIEKSELESQTLESILVLGDLDYVISKNCSKVPVSELVGKNILLYFSAQWCPPCRTFLPKFIQVYEEIKAKDDGFEVIFVSSDRDPSSFEDFFASMPWLAIPFVDERKPLIKRKFGINGIPAIVALGSDGKIVTKEGRQLISAHGSDAYPFTEEHLKHLEKKLEEMAKGWPEKLTHELHPRHELKKTRRSGYICNGCQEMGYGWSFYCQQCDFDLHPKCAIKEGEGNEEKWVCEGDKCRKA